jgi:hypothetical protein
MRVLFIAMIIVLSGDSINHAAEKRDEPRKGSRSIESLKLSPQAKKAAELLLKQYPDIVFTSGRRDLAGQARAMAGNVVKKRDWIEKTYASNDASKACQKWVDEHPEAKTQKQVAAVLLETLKRLGPKAGQISRHLTGDAFDVQPVKKNPNEVKKSIKELPGVKQFLDKEGGLEIWHVGF